MSDVHDKITRSYNMSQIRAKDTKPEIIVRKFLYSNGFRYRLHVKDMPGSPDLVLPKYNSVIFVHGCFWHAHLDCKYFNIPKTRSDWWKNKLLSNRTRDAKHIKQLNDKGWNVIVVWECELKTDIRSESFIKLLQNLK